MATIFSKGSKEHSVNELVVNTLNRSDKIRQQGIEQLKGMQDAYQWHQQVSKDIVQGLEDKTENESYYRKEAFRQDKEANEYYNNTVLQRMQQEAKNSQARAQTKINQINELAKLAPKLGTLAQQVEDRHKQKVVDAYNKIGEALPERTPENDKVYDWFHKGLLKGEKVNEELKAKIRERLVGEGDQGISDKELDLVLNAGNRARIWMGNANAINISEALEPTDLLQFETTLQPPGGGEPKKRSIQHIFEFGTAEERAAGLAQFNSNYYQTHAGPDGSVSHKQYKRYIEPKVRNLIGDLRLKYERKDRQNYSKHQETVQNASWLTSIMDGARANSEIELNFVDGVNQAFEDYKVRNGLVGKKVQPHHMSDFVGMLINLDRQNAIPRGVLQSLKEWIPKSTNRIPFKDAGTIGWNDGDTKTPWAEKFKNTKLAHLVDAVDDQIHAKDQEWDARHAKEQLNRKVTWEAQISDFWTEVFDTEGERFTPEFLAKWRTRAQAAGNGKLIKLLGNQLTPREVVAKNLHFDVIEKILRNEIDGSEIMELPVDPVTKSLWLDKWKAHREDSLPADYRTSQLDTNKKFINQNFGLGMILPEKVPPEVSQKHLQMRVRWDTKFAEGMLLFNRDKQKAFNHAQEDFLNELKLGSSELPVEKRTGNYAVDDTNQADPEWVSPGEKFSSAAGTEFAVGKKITQLTQYGNNEEALNRALTEHDILDKNYLTTYLLNTVAGKGTAASSMVGALIPKLGGAPPYKLIKPQVERLIRMNPSIVDTLKHTYGTNWRKTLDQHWEDQTIIYDKRLFKGRFSVSQGPMNSALMAINLYNVLRKEGDTDININPWNNAIIPGVLTAYSGGL